MIVCFGESFQPVPDASSASFVHACYNALDRTITIFLLVRQELWRIGQVVTQPQRRCVRIEDFRCLRWLRFAPLKSCCALSIRAALRMWHTTSCSVSSSCCCRLRRYPPYVVIHKEAAAMRAYVRQGDSSDSVDGCADPVCKSPCPFSIFSRAMLGRPMSSEATLSWAF